MNPEPCKCGVHLIGLERSKCPICSRDEALADLRHAVRRMLRAEERAFKAQETPTFAAVHWEMAWWKAHEKYRKQVEELL